METDIEIEINQLKRKNLTLEKENAELKNKIDKMEKLYEDCAQCGSCDRMWHSFYNEYYPMNDCYYCQIASENNWCSFCNTTKLSKCWGCRSFCCDDHCITCKICDRILCDRCESTNDDPYHRNGRCYYY